MFQVAPETGLQTGSLEVPLPCGHAGGIAYSSDGRVYLADTHTLFAFPLDGAFAPDAPPIKAFPLGPGLTGGLAAAAGTALWIGTYETDGPGRLFQFDAADLRRIPDGTVLTANMAKQTLQIPSYAQGAAIDPDHRHLWVSRSGIGWATLDELDLASGQKVARYPAPAGLEGLDFDPGGTLWSVSEAGARRFYSNLFVRLFFPFNPLIIAIQPTQLRPE